MSAEQDHTGEVRGLQDPPMIEKVQEFIERYQEEHEKIEQENRMQRKYSIDLTALKIPGISQPQESPYLKPFHTAREMSSEMRNRRHQLPHMIITPRSAMAGGGGEHRSSPTNRDTERPNDTIRPDRAQKRRLKRNAKTTGGALQSLSSSRSSLDSLPSPESDKGRPYCTRQPYIKLPGSKPEGILSFPHGRFFTHLAEVLAAEESTWIEENRVSSPDQRVSLDNFEEVGGRINTPLSIQAMRKLGVLQEDITPRNPHDVLHACEGDKDVAALRYDFEEKSRTRLLHQLRTERERFRTGTGGRVRHLGGAEVETMDKGEAEESAGHERGGEGAGEGEESATSPDEAWRRGRDGGRSPRSPREAGVGSARGSRIASRQATSSGTGSGEEGGHKVRVKWEVGAELMNKLMLKADRIESIQLRRMSALLRSHIASKDRMEDLQERLQRKFDYKAELLEQQRLRVREEREKKMVLSEQRRSQIRSVSEKAYEEQMVRRQEKITAAEALQREATHRVKQKVRMQAEEAKLKHHRHLTRVNMANRADEYRKELIVERIERQQRQQDALEQQLREVRKDTERRQLKMQERKDAFMAVVQTYRETGSFHTTGGLDGVKGLLDFNPHVAPVEEVYEDMNPEATLLQDNRMVEGAVQRGRYANFKLLNHDASARICVTLRSREGDPDLYIGNHLCPNPTREDYMWSKSDRGDDRVTIHSFDQGFIVGYFYIAVHGLTDSKFTLTARCKADKQDNTHKDKDKRREKNASGAHPYHAPNNTSPRRKDPALSPVKLAAVEESGEYKVGTGDLS